MTPVGDPLGIFHRFPCVGKQPLHLLLAFYKILAALIAHPVLIRQLFAGLDTKQDIVGLHIGIIGVVHVIGSHKRDVQFFADLQKAGVYHPLLWQPMILQL